MDVDENNNEIEDRNGQVHVPVTGCEHLWELTNNVVFTLSLWMLHNSALVRSVMHMQGTLQVRDSGLLPYAYLMANAYQECLPVRQEYDEFKYDPLVPQYDAFKYQNALRRATTAINYDRDYTRAAMLFFTSSFLFRKLVFKRFSPDGCISPSFWSFFVVYSILYQMDFLNSMENAFCDMYSFTNITGLDAGVDPLEPVYKQLSLSSGIMIPMFPVVSDAEIKTVNNSKDVSDTMMNLLAPLFCYAFMATSYMAMNCFMSSRCCGETFQLRSDYSNFVFRDVVVKIIKFLQSCAVDLYHNVTNASGNLYHNVANTLGNLYRKVTATNPGLLLYHDHDREGYGSTLDPLGEPKSPAVATVSWV
jgi:hypothetical protein